MRLLLDVHHSRLVAERLRREQHDVVAAADDRRLGALADEDLLRFATAERRAVVTENVKDFDRIVRTWSTTGEHHCGVVFTSPRRFHRGRRSYPEDLVASLRRLLQEPAREDHDRVTWLT
ncbi:MAG: DUF5615 family PIN-like protein [Candidatus Dormiibacterota bacterium]